MTDDFYTELRVMTDTGHVASFSARRHDNGMLLVLCAVDGQLVWLRPNVHDCLDLAQLFASCALELQGRAS